jgi:CRP-like cAMP-binding protein
LGLSAALENTGYEASAETLEPCVISFINAESLRGLMKKDPEIAYRVARHLSFEVQSAWGQMRSLGTQATTIEKLSRFLISIAGPEGRIGMHLTQREVADLIGVARETVTRSFAELCRNGVVQVHGHVITITDSDELERLATT